MAEKTPVSKIESIFFEETSTRKPLINYTVKYFSDTYPIIMEAKEEGKLDELEEIALGQLNRNSQHIAALYVSGIINLENGNYQDTHIERLLSIFKNIKKWGVVEYLAQQVLEYKEMDYALRYLASYYQVVNKEDKAVDVWERLIKFDKENHELPEKIAHIKEREDDKEAALKYYKIALERNIAKRRERAVETAIKKIMEMSPDELKYFLKIEQNLAELLEADTIVDIWKQLFFHFFEGEEYEKALVVIKRIISYEEEIKKVNIKKAKFFRHRLVDTYKALYPEHSAFDEFAKLSHLTNVYKESQWCVDTFEKHIQFDVKKYVYHRNFGAGRIKSISPEEVIIDFKDSPGHRMTFEMVMKSVSVIDEEDIRVYKAYRLRTLKQIALEDPNKLVKMALKDSIGDRISSKELKHILTPDVIAENQYNKWLDSAKKAIRAHNDLKFVKNAFVFKQGAMTYDEETLDNFKREKDFNEKFNIYMNYSGYAKDINCKESIEMVSYFVDVVQHESADYKIIKSIFLIHLLKNEKNLQIDFEISVDDAIKNVENFVDVYEALPIAKLREKWVMAIIKNFPDTWQDVIKDFLYVSQVKNHHIITDKLIQMDKIDVLEKTIDDILIKYKEYTEPFLYFSSKLLENEYEEEVKEIYGRGIKYNKEIMLVGLLNLIPYLNRLMEKKENLNQNRKMLKTVYELLFDEQNLIKFIAEEKEASVEKVFKEFKKLIGIENHYKTMVITAVTKRFPNLT